MGGGGGLLFGPPPRTDLPLGPGRQGTVTFPKVRGAEEKCPSGDNLVVVEESGLGHSANPPPPRGVWHGAVVVGCLLLVAPIGLSPLVLLTPSEPVCVWWVGGGRGLLLLCHKVDHLHALPKWHLCQGFI